MSKFIIENHKGEFLQYNPTLESVESRPYKWGIKEYATNISTDMMKKVMPILVSYGEDIQTFKYNEV